MVRTRIEPASHYLYVYIYVGVPTRLYCLLPWYVLLCNTLFLRSPCKALRAFGKTNHFSISPNPRWFSSPTDIRRYSGTSRRSLYRSRTPNLCKRVSFKQLTRDVQLCIL